MDNSDHDPEDPQPDADALARIAALRTEQIDAIDAALLANADHRWRKIALLVAIVMTGPSRVPGIPDVFYAQRVSTLVSRGLLEAQGVLSRMRYCEVRVPAHAGSGESSFTRTEPATRLDRSAEP